MRAIRAVLIGAVIVGTLDALDAIVFFGLRNGVTPSRMFQSIASGLLGRDAFRGGLPAAVLGAGLHYFIAFAIVLTYWLASRAWPALTKYPFVCGTIYGIGVYFFMNLVVIPLSAIGPQPFVTGPLVNGLFIHVFGIGVPSALTATFGARRR